MDCETAKVKRSHNCRNLRRRCRVSRSVFGVSLVADYLRLRDGRMQIALIGCHRWMNWPRCALGICFVLVSVPRCRSSNVTGTSSTALSAVKESDETNIVWNDWLAIAHVREHLDSKLPPLAPLRGLMLREEWHGCAAGRRIAPCFVGA